jgi:predicted AlkP superfamily phosphohydrolase/phosphomutase
MNIRKRVAVLGLDGVPFPLLKDLVDSGVMPRLAEIVKTSTWVPMRSSLPAVSSVAWTSFMTGANPGEHGVYGFTDVREREVALQLPSFDSIRCPVIWQRIPDKVSVVVNLPFTYPARPLNGTLIAGFVAPVLERAVYPPSLMPWLKSKNYRIDVDAVRGRTDPRFLIADLFDTLNVQEEVMRALMEREPWDLFIGVITGTDRLHHFFFDAYTDRSHPFHQDFVDYYRRVDSAVGRFVDRLSGNDRLILLSDHGFTRLKTQVYLNHILSTIGYLSFMRSDPQSLADISPESRAFAMDPTRVYLNTKDRFRTGILSPSEAEETGGRLKNDLARLRLADVGIRNDPDVDPEEALFEEVHLGADLYHGQASALAPDLVIIPRRGYDVKAALNVSMPVWTDIFTGMHTHDDAFLMVNDATMTERLSNPEISDVAGLVLEVLDSPSLVHFTAR